MSTETTREGIVIAIEGIDGAGKTTQADRIAEALSDAGESTTLRHEPTDGKWGQLIRQSAETGRMGVKEETEAFIKDRQEHVENVIRPAYESGGIVILDRYYHSTIAYQGSRGESVEDLQIRNESFAVPPDMVFLLDLPPEVALTRVNSRGVANEFEKLEDLRAVREIFLELEAANENIWLINATCSADDVFGSILHLLFDNVLKQKRCAKPYECDGFYCIPRLTGECQWANLRKALVGQHRNVAYTPR